MYRQVGLLKIREIPIELPVPEKFTDWFIEKMQELFYVNAPRELLPMAHLFSSMGSVVVIPDFSDQEKKTTSMKQIKLLAHTISCGAYGFISEGYHKHFTIPDNVDPDKFVENIDPRISNQPDRQEILMAHIEIKHNAKKDVIQAIWNITRIDGKRRLEPVKLVTDPDDVRSIIAGII